MNDRARNLKVILAGAGYVANHHAAALARLDFVRIVGVCDRDLAAARRLADRHAIPSVAATLGELAHCAADAVYVLTPPASHCALALEALAMGAHVFVEKPMAESAEECQRMIDAARERGLLLSVNHSDLFDPVVARAVAMARSGALGTLVGVDVLRGSEYAPFAGGPLPPLVRQGSYPFRDLGVHGLYTIASILGPVRALRLRCRATGLPQPVAYDEWTAEADCDAGVGRILLTLNARPMENRLVIRGTRAIVRVDRFLQTLRVERTFPGPKFVGMAVSAVWNGLADAVQVPWNVLRFLAGSLKPSPGIQRGAALFAQAVRDGTPAPVDAEAGRDAVALLEAACADADAGRRRELDERLRPLPQADVLVTGAAGFLGRALVARLVARGLSVRVLVRRHAAALERQGVAQQVIGDLGDPAIVAHAVRGVATVYHVGAAMRGWPQDFEAGTVWGTRNVVEACLASGTRRLVYVSSMSVLDHAGRREGERVDESYRYEPLPQLRGAYTRTKLQAERCVLEAVATRGLPAIVVRPGQIFGPGAEQVTPNGVVAIAGLWLAVGGARQRLPLVYLDDVVDALLQAADAPAGAEGLYNVVDATPVTQGEFLARARPVAGRRVLRLPRIAMLALAMPIELLGRVLKREVPLTRYRVHSLRPLDRVEAARAGAVLGWRPAVGVAEGMRRVYDRVPGGAA